MRRGREFVVQALAAAPSEVVISLDDERRAGDLRCVVEHGEPPELGEVAVDVADVVAGHPGAEELGPVQANPHLGFDDGHRGFRGRSAGKAGGHVGLGWVADQRCEPVFEGGAAGARYPAKDLPMSTTAAGPTSGRPRSQSRTGVSTCSKSARK